ncbi:putative nucleoside-diphosphate-sugar epimerase [Hypoxylon rubiginosum]|uniref:Nucleoside-diphosphate-sugar epimerase n=1 Tax=Hypoxylon rubiginosum TaxID=110542 RepID=A0ACB9YK87_9PEZI|nr:putative nucleoside-diphosphate-sugar epimerase [Hypoxylon rubiginosum]
MKLIVSGATGFVAREVIRQSISKREITSVIALARRPVSVPDNLQDGADPSKLKSVIVEDYDHYSEDVIKEFAGSSACIWTVAITPSKSNMYNFDEVKRVCQACTIAGFKAIHQSGLSKPFRFLYLSGAGIERDQTKTLRYQPKYMHMRGDTETKVLALAKEFDVEATAARPGFITAPGDILKYVIGTVVQWSVGIPTINVVDLAAVMLDQAVNGFEKDPLMPEDLAKIAKGIQDRK